MAKLMERTAPDVRRPAISSPLGRRAGGAMRLPLDPLAGVRRRRSPVILPELVKPRSLAFRNPLRFPTLEGARPLT